MPHHGEDQRFYIFRQYLCFGEELGRAETQLGHFKFRNLAARVDHNGQGAHLRMLTQPVNDAEAIAIRQLDIQYQQVWPLAAAHGNGFLPGRGVRDVHPCAFKAGDQDVRQIMIIFNQKNVRWAFRAMQYTA